VTTSLAAPNLTVDCFSGVVGLNAISGTGGGKLLFICVMVEKINYMVGGINRWDHWKSPMYELDNEQVSHQWLFYLYMVQNDLLYGWYLIDPQIIFSEKTNEQNRKE
jgi:hypothetical protein